jgi:regulator of sigma E protease
VITTIIFLIVLAVLIFVHELGHFILAKIFGIRVDAFALGFGPKIISWKRGETTYALNMIPFGGYVKIHGENPDQSTHDNDSHRSLVNKSPIKQISVLIAGIFFNFLFAWLIYMIVFVSGVSVSSSDFQAYKDHMSENKILITMVSPDSPAKKAGLVVGDVVVSSEVKDIADIQNKLAHTITDIQKMIRSSDGNKIIFTIKKKDASTVTGDFSPIEIAPSKGLVGNDYAIGIGMQDVASLKLPFFQAFWESFKYTGLMIKETALSLYGFFADIFKGSADFSAVSGPIGIAGIVGDSAKLGLTYLLMVTAIISINLGVINLIPFPALDGGRIFLVLIESIFRKKIPSKFSNTLNSIGFVLLMTLMIVVTYKDILKIFD